MYINFGTISRQINRQIKTDMKDRNDRKKRIFASALTFGGILVIWELAVRLADIPLYIMPAPTDICRALVAERELLLFHSIVTLKETFAGIIIALVLAVILAVLMDRFGLFNMAVYPILVVSQTVPVIVLAPIFIICFGFGMLPKILMVVLMCFFPIVISFADGMRQTDENQVNLVKLFGAGTLKVYTLVKIPSALPGLFSGMKVAATYSITGAVVGEWLASNSGLGYYMLRAKNSFAIDEVFACVAVVILLSLAMNGLVRILQLVCMPHLREKTC